MNGEADACLKYSFLIKYIAIPVWTWSSRLYLILQARLCPEIALFIAPISVLPTSILQFSILGKQSVDLTEILLLNVYSSYKINQI